MSKIRRDALRAIWWIGVLALIAYNLYIEYVIDVLNPFFARSHDYLFYGLFGLFAVIRLVKLAIGLLKRPNPTFRRTASRPLN